MKIASVEQIYDMLSQDSDIYSIHSYFKNGKSHNQSLGRIWLNLLLPEDFPIVDEPENNKLLSKTITQVFEQFGTEIATETATKLNLEAHKMATLFPQSFSMDTFIVPPEIKAEKEATLKADMNPNDFYNKQLGLGNDHLDYLDKNNIPGANIVRSGAKGSPIDWSTLTIAKGTPTDLEGNKLPTSTSSISEGFNIQEYANNADEARRGFYIRSESTAEPGALARDVCYANSPTTIDEISDCGTKKYARKKIDNTNISKLMGRFYLSEDGNLKEVHHNLVGKTVDMRSPLYCKLLDFKLCHTCFGRLSEKLESPYVGVTVGTIINQAAVAGFAMKARHNASASNVHNVDFTKDLFSSI